jgi:uncharacterized protein with PIN domain
MSVASLERAIPEGERALIDASTLIAFFNQLEQASPVAEHVIESMVRPGRNPAAVSAVTAMEVLVRPLRRGAGEPYRHVVDFLTRFPNLVTAEVDLAVAQEAASLRATYALAAPAALVVAIGIVSQVGHLVTNDLAWKRKLQPIARRIRVCYLADHLPFP